MCVNINAFAGKVDRFRRGLPCVASRGGFCMNKSGIDNDSFFIFFQTDWQTIVRLLFDAV